MKTVVVIPTYNERDNIVPLLTRLAALPVDLDLFFVDDGSPDRTGELLDSLRADYPQLRVLHRQGKLGLGTAYREAFRHLLKEPYDRMISMDADLSHPPEAIPELLSASERADLVIGSRYVAGSGIKNWPLSRRVLSRVANGLARTVLGVTVKDVTAGFRCFTRPLVEALLLSDLRSNGYSYLVELTYYTQALGYVTVERPIVFVERVNAQSKMNRAEIAHAVRTLLRLSSAVTAKRI